MTVSSFLSLRPVRTSHRESRRTELALLQHQVSVLEQKLVTQRRLAQEILSAASVRDAAADANDVAEDLRQQGADLALMLSPNPRHEYGADWPARRWAAMVRGQAKADRESTRSDLEGFIASCLRR